MSSAALITRANGADEGAADERERPVPPETEAVAEWELNLKSWPILPPASLPGIVGEFVSLATRESEADPAAVLATFLVRFGAEVFGYESGRGPALYIGETLHPPRLFVAICGASSKARKGTSARPVKRLFALEQSEQSEESTTAGFGPARESSGPLSTGEGLAFQVRDARREWRVSQKSNEGSWIVSDPGETDKRLFILDEELAAALSCSKREGNTLSACLRVFWDSGDYAPITKSVPVRTTGAHVCITTHITLEELSMALTKVQAFNGFGNRFLWICARRSKRVPFPPQMPDTEFVPIQQEILRLAAMAQRRGVMMLDDHARQLWEQVYDDLSQDHPGLAGCIINRAEAQTQRLALIYALLDGQDQIGEAHLQAALGFWSYAKQSALYIFGGRAENPVEETLLSALAGSPKTTTELFKSFSGHIGRDTLQDALQKLIGRGTVVREEERTKGRPRQLFRLRASGEVCEESEVGGEPAKVTSHLSLCSDAPQPDQAQQEAQPEAGEASC